MFYSADKLVCRSRAGQLFFPKRYLLILSVCRCSSGLSNHRIDRGSLRDHDLSLLVMRFFEHTICYKDWRRGLS